MSKATKKQRSLKAVVGQQTYSVWVDMLRVLVPEGRTHRLAPLVAGMLQYALSLANEQDAEEDSVAQSLLSSADAMEVAEVEELLEDVVAQLFKDAGVHYKRVNARGQDYSIAESIYEEYIHWFDMPWEA
jgi:F0F1-type ATP synthase delta subunit